MTDSPGRSAGRDPVDRWLLRHPWLTVLAVMTFGLALRIAAMHGTYLGSDEAIHVQLVSVSSLADVYRATLTNAHPPLFFFLLHFWRLIDSSEFVLRLLPALVGTLLIWVVYRWADRLFEKRVAFFASILVAFAPAYIRLSSEIRGYTLLLLLMASALFLLERTIETGSVAFLAGSSLSLALAVLTHYSGLWFAAVAFAYVSLRAIRGELPRRLIVVWLAFQIGLAGLCVGLYLSHLSELRGSHLELAVRNHAEYFYPSQEGALRFTARQSRAFFAFLLAPIAAVGGLVALVAAVLILAARRRPAALLLGLPFALAIAAGLARVYPFGGSRHSSHLLLFGTVAIAFATAAVSRGRTWPALLLGLFLGAAAWTSRPDPRMRDLTHMKSAVAAIRGAVATGSVLFTDFHSGLTLSPYLGGSDYFRENTPRGPFWKSRAGGYQLFGSYHWVFNTARFLSELRRLDAVCRLHAGQTIWVVHVGREIDPARALAGGYPGATVGRKFQFGEITIVEARLP